MDECFHDTIISDLKSYSIIGLGKTMYMAIFELIVPRIIEEQKIGKSIVWKFHACIQEKKMKKRFATIFKKYKFKRKLQSFGQFQAREEKKGMDCFKNQLKNFQSSIASLTRGMDMDRIARMQMQQCFVTFLDLLASYRMLRNNRKQLKYLNVIWSRSFEIRT